MSAQLQSAQIITGDFGNGNFVRRAEGFRTEQTAQRASSGSARSDAVRLRLTRRGRVVLGALGTVIAAALLALVAFLASPEAVASGGSSASTGDQFSYVVPQAGETLWGLAEELDPQSDPRDLVSEIVQLNQLDGSGLQAGDPIAVPLRYSKSPLAVSASDLGL